MEKETKAQAVAVGAAVGLCAIALAYALSRAVQAYFFPSPDPRLVTHIERIAFFWRAQLALYVGVIATLGALAWRSRDPERFDRLLPPLAVATGLVVALQGIFVP
jgi:hypothetical protein